MNDFMQTLKEGAAKIRIADGVFYNPKMSKLRDISVLFLRVLGGKDSKLLDTTAATGVRGIRYAKEAGMRYVTMLDINEKAYRNAKRNAASNKVRASTLNSSLQEFANTSRGAFDVIDIDPFGSPVPMIDDALKVSKGGTLMMITATDTATLCGAEGSACLRVYGSQPIHNELCHEAGVRILLSFAAREAARFNFGMEPILSISDMHYFRIFVRLTRGSKNAVQAIRNSGYGTYCGKCHNFSYQKGIVASANSVCGYCGNKMQAFGPLWLGHLKHGDTVKRMLALSEEYQPGTQALLRKISEEYEIPFFYSLSKITAYLKSGSVPLEPVLLELNKKHTATRTHFEENAVKTDAGIAEVVRVVKNK